MDVERFGDPRRGDQHRVALRAGLYQAVQEAFRLSHISWAECYHEDRGDGFLVLAPPEVLKGLFVEVLPAELVAALDRYNRVHPAEERIRLRVALHAGELTFDEHGVAGSALNLAFRLLDAEPFKSTLAESSGVLALITSSWFFEEVVRHSTFAEPAAYRPIQIAVKEVSTVGWIRLPEPPQGSDERRSAVAGWDSGLVGRSAELRRLDALVAGAWAGHSGVLVIKGESGIGKTALLEAAMSRYADLRTLRVQCVETEAELAFAALGDLLRPVGHLRDQLPRAQAEALEACLTAAEPPQSSTVSTLRVGLATLGLLAAAAAHDPLLVVIDDAQWLDSASAAALSFAARRLEAEGVALFAAVRSNAPSAFEASGLAVLDLAGLPDEAAEQLLAKVNGSPVPADVLRRMQRHSQGNPLALIELSGHDVAHRTADLDQPLPPPQTIARLWQRRFDALPAVVGRTLLVSAASFTGEVSQIVAALGPSGLASVESAEAEGLITFEGDRVIFAHPLVRSAAYYGASAQDRRAAHSSLAAVVAGKEGSTFADQYAWHLAAAALGPDQTAAQALAETGERNRRRGALDAACSAYVRASELTTGQSLAVDLMIEAASCAYLAGKADTAVPILDRAQAMTADSGALTEIHRLRTQIQFTRSSPREIFVHLSRAAQSLADDAPLTAAAMLCTAAGVGAVGALVSEALDAAEQAHALVAGEAGAASLAPAVLHAHVLLLTGRSAIARRLLVPRMDQLLATDPLEHGVEVFGFGSMDLMWLGEYGHARHVIDHALETIRAAGAEERKPALLSVLADLEMRLGRWHSAYSAATACISVAEATDQPLLVAYGASTLARIEAAQGQERRCRDYAERARQLLDPSSPDLVTPYARMALGQLELALGAYDRAAHLLLGLARQVDDLGVHNPAVFPLYGDLIEACMGADLPEEAARCLADFAAATGPDDSPATRALLARCNGQLTSDIAVALGHFETALTLHADLSDGYEAARTHLAFARRLRQAGHHDRARTELEAAHQGFGALGAAPWRIRAETELRAFHQPRAGLGTPVQASLNAQELQIAHLIAGGATDQEAADILLISAQTIHHHLQTILAKLGVGPRADLARAFQVSHEPSAR
ncbi:LuxR family transcriptional regulator [Actinomadura fulvescens]|uniref:LuxR family transcriptional regulator n=1 Tax=Actinomadura fulvescens TaxID=46160 RepID=UPI0031E1C934